jgi:hypothetical protein
VILLPLVLALQTMAIIMDKIKPILILQITQPALKTPLVRRILQILIQLLATALLIIVPLQLLMMDPALLIVLHFRILSIKVRNCDKFNMSMYS